MSRNMDSLSSGQGIQVVTPSEDHTFLLHEDALHELLLREDVKDRPVVLVSVAGAYRKGKSFLLDFFLRYLDRTYNNGEGGGEWLGKENESLKGFSWRGGSDRHTTGIHLWSQPFKTTLANGEKVVVLLMDTQGTFDSNSTVKDNATVFALSTMLSSVQIYNLSQNIEEDDLQHLQLFMEYGRVAKDEIGGKPFQRLQFLVRDWSYPYDHPYGAVGGEQLLKKRLTVREGQHSELQRVRQDIARCFEDVTCFLMPYPGSKVSTDPNFSGKLSDIDVEFKSCLKQLVPMLLAPENLVTKKIGGQKVKARDLLNYFKSYVDVFNSEELPNPMTILQATAEANNTSASSEARNVYETLMEEVCGGTKPYMNPEMLDEEHKKCLNKALHAFESKKKMGGEEMAAKFKELLVKDLEDLYKQLSAHNEGKNVHNMLSTPLVFLALLIVGYLLSVLGSTFGVQTVVAVGQAVTLGAAGMLAVWLYTRWTGSGREIGMQLDDIANQIKSSNVAVFMYVLSGLGVTCGVHRYWTHRSYKATLPLQILLLFMFSCASQTSVRLWARNHRLHHKFSDTAADPHNVNRGLFYAHIGWLMMKKHPEALRKGRTIDMSDIDHDPLLQWHEKNILWINLLCCFVLPTLAGVWLWGEVWQTAVTWQCFIRYAGAFHCEFTVNSLAHAYGYRPYNKSIAPAESWYVSLTTMGEGWHNYHHAFPYDYKAAEYCDFLNLSTAFIRMCRRVGWAYDLKEATPEAVRSLAKRLGDGTAINSEF